MFKKILVGMLVIGLIGILVAGAINRTNAKTGSSEARGQGWSRGDVTTAYAAGRGQGGGGQGRGNATGDQAGTGQAQADEWVTLQGTVVSRDQNVLVVEASNGEQVTVENRPWLFAQEQGLSAQVGDPVTLTGFYEGDEFKVGQITDVNGKTVPLRDESGRPGWAGRGRRSG